MTTKLLRLSFSLVAAILLITLPAQAQENWPMYNHDPGLTGRTGEYLAGNTTLRWERQFPQAAHVRAQPIIVDGVVYQTWMDGSVRALDLDTGADRWAKNVSGLIFGSACVTANRVVVAVYAGDHGVLIGYDKAGKQVWSVDAPEPFFASPIAHRGRIFIGGLDGFLWAVDAENGVVLWRVALGGQVWGAAAAANGVVAVEADDLKGHSFNADTGAMLWTADLPGETVRHSNPLVAKGTVIFTTGARADSYRALEGTVPVQPENPFVKDGFETLPAKTLPQVLAETQTAVSANAAVGTTLAVSLDTGQKKFDTYLPTPYWGSVTPTLLTDNLMLKFAWEAVLSVDLDTGTIALVSNGNDLLLRGDEHSYVSVGGGRRYYGAIADDLGEVNLTTKTKRTLVGDFYSHAVPEWAHPPDAKNAYLTAPGPGDGNSGYVGTPVIYNGYVVWQYAGSWLRCDKGTAAREIEDKEPPATPAGLHVVAATGNTITLAWNASTDNVGVRGYRVYRDDVLVAETDAAGYIDVGLQVSTSYTYRVSAYDAQGNESPKSDPAIGMTGNMADPDAGAPPTLADGGATSGDASTPGGAVVDGASSAGNGVGNGGNSAAGTTGCGCRMGEGHARAEGAIIGLLALALLCLRHPARGLG